MLQYLFMITINVTFLKSRKFSVHKIFFFSRGEVLRRDASLYLDYWKNPYYWKNILDQCTCMLLTYYNYINKIFNLLEQVLTSSSSCFYENILDSFHIWNCLLKWIIVYMSHVLCSRFQKHLLYYMELDRSRSFLHSI